MLNEYEKVILSEAEGPAFALPARTIPPCSDPFRNYAQLHPPNLV